jgi:hypothetical protein
MIDQALRQISHNAVSEVRVIDYRGNNDAAFFDKHKMTRADYEARAKLWAEDAAESAILAPVEGDVPDSIIVKAKLTPARLRLARYIAWRQQCGEEVGRLTSERKRHAALLDAPAQAKGRIAELVKAGARALLGGGEVTEGAEHQRAEAELAAAEYKAQAARAAIAELDDQIAIKQRQYSRLVERQTEFLRPAIIEQADTLKSTLPGRRRQSSQRSNGDRRGPRCRGCRWNGRPDQASRFLAPAGSL